MYNFVVWQSMPMYIPVICCAFHRMDELLTLGVCASCCSGLHGNSRLCPDKAQCFNTMSNKASNGSSILKDWSLSLNEPT